VVLFPEIPGIVVLFFWLLVLVVLAVLIDGILKYGNKFIEAQAKQQIASSEEIETKIELMIQRMQVIENKVDKINTILEKVSD